MGFSTSFSLSVVITLLSQCVPARAYFSPGVIHSVLGRTLDVLNRSTQDKAKSTPFLTMLHPLLLPLSLTLSVSLSHPPSTFLTLYLSTLLLPTPLCLPGHRQQTLFKRTCIPPLCVQCSTHSRWLINGDGDGRVPLSALE